MELGILWTSPGAERDNRGLMSCWRRVATCALVALAACAATAAAQAGKTMLTLTVTLPDGAPPRLWARQGIAAGRKVGDAHDLPTVHDGGRRVGRELLRDTDAGEEQNEHRPCGPPSATLYADQAGAQSVRATTTARNGEKRQDHAFTKEPAPDATVRTGRCEVPDEG